MSCVYKHTFPNGAVYIGKTDMSPEDRWLNGWGYRTSPLMFSAIIKFGWDNVSHEIIADNLTHDEAIELEREEIKKACAIACTYNIAEIDSAQLVEENAHYIGEQLIKTAPKIESPHVSRKIKCSIPVVIKPNGTHSLPVNVYDLNGNFVATYPSAKIASIELNLNHGNIISCCRGGRPNGKPQLQVGGFIFRYKIEE